MRNKMATEARLRIMRLARQRDTLKTVEGVEQRTSVNDARIALCIALGVDPDDIDPTSGCALTRKAYENARHSWRWNIRMHGWNDWYERNLNEALAWWRERRPEFVDGDDWPAGLTDDMPSREPAVSAQATTGAEQMSFFPAA
jgi:hypothetical protein